jgi:hypothetical protein
MIDFTAVREKRLDLGALAAGLSKSDLKDATRAITADVDRRIHGVRDVDVTFVPLDPGANDEFAADSTEVGLAWTLGHVVVHLTASAEESAFLAAELARGVPAHGRSRYETPWESVTTIAECRARLAESERMILASLESWPDEPHLEIVYVPTNGTPRNAIARFLGGVMHADSHLEQLTEIARQAAEARTTAVSAVGS